jgi:hypothetical protein
MTRAEVEILSADDGLHFTDKGRYVHPSCGYLKLEVEYEPDPARSGRPCPEDKVKSISRPFVEYETKDSVSAPVRRSTGESSGWLKHPLDEIVNP